MPPAADSPSRPTVRPLLSVRDLRVAFDTDGGRLTAVDGVSFDLAPGQVLGLVGESGCGKSVTALSVMRLLPQPMGKILGGQILLDGEDLVALPDAAMRRVRGARIGMIFQEPMSALNPVHTIGRQVSEVFLLHQPQLDKKGAWEKSIEMLAKVGIPSPQIRMSEYPHQLSGGMRQRVVIAMALALNPRLVIADEPTTALDVTIQAQILDLLRRLRDELGTAVLLITHDLGVINEMCEEVVVMYAGRIAERAANSDLFRHPHHPYTRGLLHSIPRLDGVRKSRLHTIEGMVPSLAEMPAGCRFQNRCPFVADLCRTTPPPLEQATGVHTVACHRWRELPAPTAHAAPTASPSSPAAS